MNEVLLTLHSNIFKLIPNGKEYFRVTKTIFTF